jgi:hypothetical protein
MRESETMRAAPRLLMSYPIVFLLEALLTVLFGLVVITVVGGVAFGAIVGEPAGREHVAF